MSVHENFHGATRGAHAAGADPRPPQKEGESRREGVPGVELGHFSLPFLLLSLLSIVSAVVGALVTPGIYGGFTFVSGLLLVAAVFVGFVGACRRR